MIIHNMEQKSDEWFAIRKGRLTASQYDKVFNQKLLKLNKATALKHIDGMLAEIYYKEDDLQKFKSSWAMERGVRLEDVARVDFELREGLEVMEVGFVTNDSFGDHIGCSPDGLIVGENGGIEIKCPLPATHMKYHREGVLPKEYRAQVHGSMAVCDADYWWFTSYCPGIKDFTMKIHRDGYTESLAQALKDFNSLFATHYKATKNLALS
jgi:predicted phage-related endonuclease